MKSEKAIISPKDYGSNNNLKTKLTMTNDTPKQLKFQLNLPQSRQSSIESSKLSRLPKLSTRPKFELQAKAAVCINCSGRLDPDDSIQQSVKVCRKCLTQYAVIDRAIDEAAKRKRQAMLEKFAPEVKR